MIDAEQALRFLMGMMHGCATTPEQMEDMGRAASKELRTGMVIGLVGDLGAGKTHWTKGLVAGLGSNAAVTSPTFGLVHEYGGGRLAVFHLDFYRLNHPEELIQLGWDEYLESEGIIVVEWANKFPELMPANTHWLAFSIEKNGTRTICEGKY